MSMMWVDRSDDWSTRTHDRIARNERKFADRVDLFGERSIWEEPVATLSSPPEMPSMISGTRRRISRR